MRTHYDNLKVVRNAPPEVIRAAYKVLCQKYHPDKFEGSMQSAERVMKILNAAYDVLSGPEKKKVYDKFLEEMEARANEEKLRESAQQGHKPNEEPKREAHHNTDDSEAKPRPHYKPYDWERQHPYGRTQPQIEYHLPWLRLFARSIDYFCGSIIVICIIGFFAFLDVWHLETDNAVMNPLILTMTSPFIWMLLEGGIIKSFGNTPGKKLFGLRIVCNNQQSNHMKRAFAVWVRGVGLGVPVASLITAAMAYSSLKSNTQTSWDKDYGFAVESEPISSVRGFSATAAVLLFFIVVIAGQVVINEWNGGAVRGTSSVKVSVNRDGNPISTSRLETYHSKLAKTASGTLECNPTPLNTDLLTRCAEQGDVKAQAELASRYYDGKGVAKDNKQAVYWLHKAAEQGDAGAQGILGWMYLEGLSVAKNNVQAFYWVRKAAAQGVAKEQYNLAMMYYEGKGVIKDDAHAIYWLREAAKQGDSKAQYKLGCWYANGQGVPQNYDEAENWYRMAAEQGYTKAQYDLDLQYANGQGLPHDSTEAAKGYRMAANPGNTDAKVKLNKPIRNRR